ncbi:hypothetical protein RIR_jg18393.t1 [Rhizophagus irregularis DAOM 181602=DAOM 197198]|nr:hypothetical protein RIR_jg18393.t1 [Rhizophagus irregularis DAOM 181602=DAOM 197198]
MIRITNHFFKVVHKIDWFAIIRPADCVMGTTKRVKFFLQAFRNKTQITSRIMEELAEREVKEIYVVI